MKPRPPTVGDFFGRKNTDSKCAEWPHLSSRHQLRAWQPSKVSASGTPSVSDLSTYFEVPTTMLSFSVRQGTVVNASTLRSGFLKPVGLVPV